MIRISASLWRSVPCQRPGVRSTRDRSETRAFPIQPAIDKASDILHNAWTGLQHTIGTDFDSHNDNRWSWHH
jgi:hypothetical protein